MENKNHKKSILFVIESLQCGGAEKSLTTLLQNISFDAYEIDLILINKGGEFEKFVPEKVNIIYKDQFLNSGFLTSQIKRIHYLLLRKLNSIQKTYHLAQQYWKAFGSSIANHDKKYAIAIAYNQGFSTYYVANKVIANKKYAWLNTDYQKAGYTINFDFKHYTQFNKVVCVSKENEISLQSAVQGIGKKIETTIIKDITDYELIKKMSSEKIEFRKEKNTTTIVTVGRLAQAKGLHMAIEACSILKKKEKNVKWYVIGEGPERNTLEELIRIHNLEKNFILLGFKENPYPYIYSCDIYTQTSLFEGLGLTVIEAAMLKKPIVTTNFPTASSIIEHDKTGIICEMNPDAIATSIENYMNNEILVKKVIENLDNRVNKDKEISLQKFNILMNN
ncbi:glycosyltransferase [Aquimarina longa]|uniref:glycosyltransferase n=1 Tax=Aquimarina longa TaxID=1080221 RepID=UPI000781DC3B|nr:glycosyltransferase [Aquimarina longa]